MLTGRDSKPSFLDWSLLVRQPIPLSDTATLLGLAAALDLAATLELARQTRICRS